MDLNPWLDEEGGEGEWPSDSQWSTQEEQGQPQWSTRQEDEEQEEQVKQWPSDSQWSTQEKQGQPQVQDSEEKQDQSQEKQAIIEQCHQLWPPLDPDPLDWRSPLPDFSPLLAQLLPDSALPPPVHFPSTATARAMNDALRHLPPSATSPLSRLLASKGSLEWQKSIRAIAPDTSHVGWRVLEKEDRVEEAKPAKPASAGFLSFWNRTPSSAPPEEPATSPSRSSLENAKSLPNPPESLPAAPSAVSRFLNRFARAKSPHSALALSSDDLEFLSDIVPSASDPPDDPLTASSMPSFLNGGAPDVPTLPPPPSPKPVPSFPPLQSTPAPKLSVPPLLPPPISPPQTPRPRVLPPITAIQPTVPDDSDDEFSAFKSFPPAPFPYPLQRSPTPPSPPPRRTYKHTHYPSSSSTSSILSPASQTSADPWAISASLDSFDDFVSPPTKNGHTPSPPPLPTKFQPRQQPSRIDTLPSRVYHAHTPSLTTTSPTVHTSLLNTSVRAEHQRTQSLVDHAAARSGLTWPDSPPTNEAQVKAIPPPRSLIGIREADIDLLGDGEALSAPSRGIGTTSTASRLSAPLLSFADLGALVPSPASQPVKPKQTGGLSAQDLSFFEGL